MLRVLWCAVCGSVTMYGGGACPWYGSEVVLTWNWYGWLAAATGADTASALQLCSVAAGLPAASQLRSHVDALSRSSPFNTRCSLQPTHPTATAASLLPQLPPSVSWTSDRCAASLELAGRSKAVSAAPFIHSHQLHVHHHSITQPACLSPPAFVVPRHLLTSSRVSHPITDSSR